MFKLLRTARWNAAILSLMFLLQGVIAFKESAFIGIISLVASFGAAMDAVQVHDVLKKLEEEENKNG